MAMQETLDIRARPAGEHRTAPGAILTCKGHDNAIRWQPGERLQHLLERRAAAFDEHEQRFPALDVDGETVSFAALDRRANQMARYFVAQGIGAGDRIGLMVDRSIASYVVLLAILKLDAAYVPLDLKFPADRISFIAEDAAIKTFVITAAARGQVSGLDLPVIELNDASNVAALLPDSAFAAVSVDVPADQLCYIIYTSGSTGRPKGVAVNHSSICNFVQVATEVYGYVPGDRVYQGMTLAFDFSVEELWVPLISGATLVPAPTDRQMVGDDLARFLTDKNITAMCCVPTLLATIDQALPKLRLLLVSGEACPPDIVARWQQPGRRLLNAYGPTEATVTATWTELLPDKAVTIGGPLPTYTIVILEAGNDALVADGAVGEIAIAGIGLAEGYVNRDDLTAKAFVPDFLHLANNPSRRLYRTGDLGRINDDDEIEYLGRIDTQVKIRGYRIELAEIENVLLEIDGVAQAVVTTHEAEQGLVELAAYYTCFDGEPKPSRERLLKELRSRLPGYMIPAYVQELDAIPLLASHKADRKSLPAPTGLRLVSSASDFVVPSNETEQVIASCLAKTMQLDAVSTEDHFFDDLGAHSLLMGQFVAALNAQMPGAKAAISDVYLAPNVKLLAADIIARNGQAASILDDVAGSQSKATTAHVASDFDFYLCGALQVAFYAAQYALILTLLAVGIGWASAADDIVDAGLRAVLFSAASLSFSMALPIVAKWLIIGRWQAERIPIWSLKFFQFWAVQQLVGVSPWVAFKGTVLFNVYLRLLGAKIGDGALILTKTVPLATDLIQIGDRSVLRAHSYLSGYKAEAGYISLGEIEIGRDVTIGEMSLVDIGTSIGDDGQLGHASALLEGQAIPAACRYHGSPAEATETDFRYFEESETSLLRRSVFAGARAASVVIATALGLLVATVLIWWFSGDNHDFQSSAAKLNANSGWWLLGVSVAVFVASYVVAFILHSTLPRLLRAMLVPGRIYPMYGVHYFIAQMLRVSSKVVGFQILFGDSSAIAHYFRWLGVKQPELQQTGSNFGTATSYESPQDVLIGSGSMVSDGLYLINFEMGSAEFRVKPARIGARCFTGNALLYPPGARVGDNCLLGSKVMVPVDGPVRENVGLLGSPAFEIPREVVSGRRFDAVPSTPAGHARLAAKNRFNLRTAMCYLASQWSLLFILLLTVYCSTALYSVLGFGAIILSAALLPFVMMAHAIVAERLGLIGFSMVPHSCTIHEEYFWRIERHWKLSETMMKYVFTGTPFRPLFLRALGLKGGRRLYDEGAIFAEKQLVEIGDDCCLSFHCTIHAHSLEDGLYKSDRIVIGDRCTVGAGSFVHYGVRMGDDTVLAPEAFLMKGGRTEAQSRWVGNPAKVV